MDYYFTLHWFTFKRDYITHIRCNLLWTIFPSITHEPERRKLNIALISIACLLLTNIPENNSIMIIFHNHIDQRSQQYFLFPWLTFPLVICSLPCLNQALKFAKENSHIAQNYLFQWQQSLHVIPFILGCGSHVFRYVLCLNQYLKHFVFPHLLEWRFICNLASQFPH